MSAIDAFPLRFKRKNTLLLLIVKRRTGVQADGCLAHLTAYIHILRMEDVWRFLPEFSGCP